MLKQCNSVTQLLQDMCSKFHAKVDEHTVKDHSVLTVCLICNFNMQDEHNKRNIEYPKHIFTCKSCIVLVTLLL
jgi:hypothetical protein